jgi:hypothetical protein
MGLVWYFRSGFSDFGRWKGWLNSGFCENMGKKQALERYGFFNIGLSFSASPFWASSKWSFYPPQAG